MRKRERILHLLRLEPGQTSDELRQRLRNQGLIVGNGDCVQRHYPVAVVQGDDGAARCIAVWKWPTAPVRLVKHDAA